jgi:hypothetical protein
MTTFKTGDRVRVVRQGLRSAGKTGTVISSDRYAVYVDVELYGRLSFNPKSLKLLDENNIQDNKGENNMLLGNYMVCKIKFTEGTNTNREYYYALYDSNISTGDYVVVKSANHGFGLAVVTDVVADEHITQAMRDYCNGGREVVDKFDMLSYENRVEKRKKAKQLKANMDKKMKELQELAVFEMMAEKNPELKDMLDEYKELIM